MIIYNKTKKEFISDIEDNLLVEILNQNFKNKLFHYTSDSEKKIVGKFTFIYGRSYKNKYFTRGLYYYSRI